MNIKSKKFFVICFSILFISSATIGFAKYILSSSSEVRGNSETVNVNFYDKQESYMMSKEWIPSIDQKIVTIDTKALEGKKESEAYALFNKYPNVGDIFEEKTEIEANKKYKIRNQCTYREEKNLIFYKKYYFTYETKKQLIETKELIHTVDKDFTNDMPLKTIKVKKGSLLDTDLINIKIPEYENIGYFTDLTCQTVFDFSKPINSNTSIYCKYFRSNSNLSNLINEYSAQVVNIYDSEKEMPASVSGINIHATNSGSDFNSYDPVSKIGFLSKTTIPFGKSVVFNYLENESSIAFNSLPVTGILGPEQELGAHRNSADGHVGLTDAINKNDLKIKLTGDLTIEGTLVIGARTGSQNGAGKMSYIIGNYTSIDLNGHNIIVKNNGNLTAYGRIHDTLNKGKIIVESGGTFNGQFTFTDQKGGNQTVYGYTKGQSPFSDYHFPYIDVPMIFKNGSFLKGLVKLDLGQIGGSNVILKILGPNKNEYLMSWRDSISSDEVRITPYYIDDFNDDTIYLNLYNKRYKLELNSNIDVNDIAARAGIKILKSVGIIDVNFETEFDLSLARFDFPISPFLDIYINKEVHLYIKLNFYPGSRLHVKSNGRLIFDFKKDGDSHAITSFSEINASYATFIVALPGEKRYLSAGINFYNTNLSEYNKKTIHDCEVGLYGTASAYYDYVGIKNSCIIEGDIVFTPGINPSGKYSLCGDISLSKKALNNVKNAAKNQLLQTYYLKSEQFGSIWFASAGDAIAAASKGNVNSILRINSFQLLPLINKGVGYMLDGSLNVIGKYNEVTNTVTNLEDGQSYFLWTPNSTLDETINLNDIPIGKGKITERDRPFNRKVEIRKANLVFDNMLISTDDGNYAFHGGVYVQVEETEINEHIVSVKANLNKFLDSSDISATNSVSLQLKSGYWCKV